MNHDNGDRQTVTESELTMWLWTQKSKAWMISARGNFNLGKDGHTENTLLRHKSYITKLQERCRLAFSGHLRWLRSWSSGCHPRIQTVSQASPMMMLYVVGYHRQKIDLHRSSGGRDCEGLRAKILSLLTENVQNEDHLLLGVLGRRQLAPLCRMW
jgi:hypothetical protein